MAAEWARRGYKVTVLTGIPNYPMGKFFDGYDYRRRRCEKWKGVRITRIPLIPRGNSANKLLNAMGMIANYLSFAASGWFWTRGRQAGSLEADLVFTVEVSPMTQALIGCWYGKRYNVPVFLYVQDLWPENVETVTGIHSRLAIAPIERMVRYIYGNTDQIFTTSPSFVREIIKRGADRKKVHYWPQYAEEFYRPVDKAEAERKLSSISDEMASLVKKIESEDAFYIAFTGNIGTAQGLDILPKVAERLRQDEQAGGLGGAYAKRVRFVIVGDGRYQEQLEKDIERRGVSEMFTFIPRQQAETIPYILALCDAAFLSFGPDKLWRMTIPAKLQSYMACGMPIIAAAEGETRRVIEDAGCGICCTLGDANALSAAIKKMASLPAADMETMKKHSTEYCKTHFNQEKLMGEMEKMMAGYIEGEKNGRNTYRKLR